MQPNPTPSGITSYLKTYNCVCALCWGIVLVSIINGLYKGDNYASLWSKIRITLMGVQAIAILEVLHAALGFVKGSVLATVMQGAENEMRSRIHSSVNNSTAVMAFVVFYSPFLFPKVSSRLIILFGYLYPCEYSQKQYAMVLCVGSWSLVEVPRYLYYYYNIKDAANVSDFLVWLRYSLFIVLYPSGILGEILTVFNSMDCINVTGLLKVGPVKISAYTFTVFLLCTYIPAAPYLFYHMVKARRRCFKKRWEHGGKKKKKQ